MINLVIRVKSGFLIFAGIKTVKVVGYMKGLNKVKVACGVRKSKVVQLIKACLMKD